MKVPRSKFNSNADLKLYAREHKNQLFSQFQSQIQSQSGMNYNPYNYNINYNISQNINQNINGGKSIGALDRPSNRLDRANPNYNHSYKLYNSSPNDSGNFSTNEEVSNLIMPPKRTFSNNIPDLSKRQLSHFKVKSSLFMSAEKEEKGEDFADLQELLDSITVDLWDYAKTQKGSRFEILLNF
jgi:hypothetical protein